MKRLGTPRPTTEKSPLETLAGRGGREMPNPRFAGQPSANQPVEEAQANPNRGKTLSGTPFPEEAWKSPQQMEAERILAKPNTNTSPPKSKNPGT